MNTIERMLWVFLGWSSLSALAIALETTLLRRHLRLLRARGISPASGKATHADVVRLRQLGQVEAAARCYQEIEHTSYRVARDRVTNDRIYHPRWLLLIVGGVTIAVIIVVTASGYVGAAIGLITFATFVAYLRRRRLAPSGTLLRH